MDLTSYRVRCPSALLTIPRDTNERDYIELLRELIAPQAFDPYGVQIAGSENEARVIRSGQLSSLYLRDVQETALTQFLEDHADLLKKALGVEEMFFQPKLIWAEGGSPDEQAIQPDLIARKRNGTWLVVDFKLPLLNREKVTAGRHRRRRFIYPVADGIAQLHNYHDYFGHAANRSLAAQKLGQEIVDPELMLVVGSSENVDLTEVNEALRAYKPTSIVDYDTLIRLSLRVHETS
jgi:hypothetical protein